MDSWELTNFTSEVIMRQVAQAVTITEYRQPLVGFAPVEDPRFRQLHSIIEPTHLLPEDM